jgi:hypothetical protein
MPGIFISYRREDSAGHAGRLFDRLGAKFGRERYQPKAHPSLRGSDPPNKAPVLGSIMIA